MGAAADEQRGVFFAACSNRRLIELDRAGRRVHELRLAGGNAVELVGPVHFNSSTQLLAVVMKGAAGVLLCDTRSTERGARLAPRARLTAGQLEPPSGVTILPGEQILACWLDGTMLSWRAPEKQVRQVSRQSDREVRRPLASPHGLGTRLATARKLSGSPEPRGKGAARGDAPRLSSVRGARAASMAVSRGGVGWFSARSEEKMVETKTVAPYTARQAPTRPRFAPAQAKEPPGEPRTEGLQELRRLLASSPSPPRWAETSVVEGDLAPPAGGESAAGAPSGAPLGKWARGSLVGAQVRSASDLQRVGPREERCDGSHAVPRCASEGAQRGRRLFCACGRCGAKPRLPPKPLFPPPTTVPAVPAESTLDLSGMSSSSAGGVGVRASNGLATQVLGLASLPTPCRGPRSGALERGVDRVQRPNSLKELVSSVVTLRKRLAGAPAHRDEAEALLAPLQRFESLLRSQMKDSLQM